MNIPRVALQNIHWRRWLVAVFLLVTAGLLTFGAMRVYAADTATVPTGRIITLYDRGVERSFVTEAHTIRAALEGAGVIVDERDRVEPELDHELVAASYSVNMYRARPLVVVDGANRQLIMTAAQLPEQIAAEANIPLYPEDTVTYDYPADILNDGAALQFVINRATTVKLTLYGKIMTVRTHAATIGAMLAEKEVTLRDDDRSSVALATPITEGMEVRVWREGKQTITAEEDVNFSIEKIQDANRDAGYREVRTAGIKGQRTVTYEIVIQDGKEVERKEIASVVTKEPIRQVEVVGAKPPFGGDLAASFAALRQCESGGNYANKNNPTYRGAYQFSYQTWANNGGYYDPADAPPALQDAAALALYQRRGWQPWPACSAKLGLR